MQQTVATTFSGELLLQADINSRGLKLLNEYCYRLQPTNVGRGYESMDSSTSSRRLSVSKERSHSTSYTSLSATFVSEESVHPLLVDLFRSMNNARSSSKNVEMIREVERASHHLRACKFTFCKSGKDRTGMVVSFEEARYLCDTYSLGKTEDGMIDMANLIRIYGTRILVAEKNIGKKVFSINKLQAQFLPNIYRPPSQCCEDLLKRDLS